MAQTASKTVPKTTVKSGPKTVPKISMSPLILMVVNAGFALFVLACPDLAAGLVRSNAVTGKTEFQWIWRLVAVELIGLSMVLSRQVFDPKRGIHLGIAGYSFLVGIFSGLLITLQEFGWSAGFALITSVIHFVAFGLAIYTMLKLPPAVEEKQSPKFIIMVHTVLLYVIGLDYLLFPKNVMGRLVKASITKTMTIYEQDIVSLASALKLWGAVKIGIGLVLMTMAKNSVKRDLYAEGSYCWLSLAATGYAFLTIGKEVFDEQEAYAIMGLQVALSMAYALLGLTWEKDDETSAAAPPASTAATATSSTTSESSLVSEDKKTK